MEPKNPPKAVPIPNPQAPSTTVPGTTPDNVERRSHDKPSTTKK